MGDEVVVLITASSAEEAAKIGRALVEERLIACANIVGGVRSLFFWEGKLQDERETLMICKSTSLLMDRIIKRVKELHSYTVPEIIALPIVAGSKEYLEWVNGTATGYQRKKTGGIFAAGLEHAILVANVSSAEIPSGKIRAGNVIRRPD